MSNFDDLMTHLLERGLINKEDEKLYRQNYDFFRSKLPEIKKNYCSMWVASLNGHLIKATSKQDLQMKIKHLENANRAYMEFIRPDRVRKKIELFWRR